MKILILSDSHGLTEEITTIKRHHQVNEMIHCGDSELLMKAPEMEGFMSVAGNCDRDTKYPVDKTIIIDGLTCFITHGHLYQVKQDLTTLSYRAEEECANVVFYGHTHIAHAEVISDKLFINPGSIRMPRNYPYPTYAILDWNKENKHIKVAFYTVDGKVVNELTYETTFSKLE